MSVDGNVAGGAAAAIPGAACQLTITRTSVGAPQSFTLQPGGAIRIGGNAGNDVVLDVPGISSRHAELFLQPRPSGVMGPGPPGAQMLCIRDSSRNGTGVRARPLAANGKPLAWERLESGRSRVLGNGWQLKVPMKSRKGATQVPEADRTLTLHIVHPSGVVAKNGAAVSSAAAAAPLQTTGLAAAPKPFDAGAAAQATAAAAGRVQKAKKLKEATTEAEREELERKRREKKEKKKAKKVVQAFSGATVPAPAPGAVAPAPAPPLASQPLSGQPQAVEIPGGPAAAAEPQGQAPNAAVEGRWRRRKRADQGPGAASAVQTVAAAGTASAAAAATATTAGANAIGADLQGLQEINAAIDAEIGLRALAVGDEEASEASNDQGTSALAAQEAADRASGTRPKRRAKPPKFGEDGRVVESSPEFEDGVAPGTTAPAAAAVTTAADVAAAAVPGTAAAAAQKEAAVLDQWRQSAGGGIRLTESSVKAVSTAAAVAARGRGLDIVPRLAEQEFDRGLLLGASVLRDMSVSPISTPGVGRKRKKKSKPPKQGARPHGDSSEDSSGEAQAKKKKKKKVDAQGGQQLTAGAAPGAKATLRPMVASSPSPRGRRRPVLAGGQGVVPVSQQRKEAQPPPADRAATALTAAATGNAEGKPRAKAKDPEKKKQGKVKEGKVKKQKSPSPPVAPRKRSASPRKRASGGAGGSPQRRRRR
mmetsp:Transcript_40298/g.110958  ORF Transcript_40298/g.110958 Transcript_40298/m.110958 type:complete len:706 (-) Transcript_40298:81-2198(-)